MQPDWVESICGVTVQKPPTPEEGLASLRELVALVQTAPPEDQATVLANWCSLEPKLVGAAAAWGAFALQVQAVLTPLRSIRGFSRLLNKLERDLERRAASPPAALPSEPAPGGPDLAHTLEHPTLVSGLRCPAGWKLGKDGLFRVRPDDEGLGPARVAHAPLLLAGRLRDLQTGQIQLRVAWASPAGWLHRDICRKDAMSAREVVALASYGAPVNSNNAPDIVRYLCEFEAHNLAVMPEARTTSRMGWQGDGPEQCFLWGHTTLRAECGSEGAAVLAESNSLWEPHRISLHVPDAGTSALAQGFRAKGSWEGWVEAVQAALPYPGVLLGLYAALVPPLMRFLPNANFIVDFCGETSRGKTTTLRLASSVWGDPDERGAGLIASWDNTRVYVERAAALANYLPTFLDDTKRARRPEDVGNTLYDFASGVGRGRGSLQGVQGTIRHRGVLLSTGEAPATSFTNAGGTRARTLCLWGSPFGGANTQTAEAARFITQQVMAHYGHAGPRVVRTLLQNANAVERVRQTYEEYHARWVRGAAGNPVADRAADYIAALDTAGWVLHDLMGLPAPSDFPILLAWNAVLQGSKDSDRAADALRDTLSWATGQQHRFYSRSEAAHQIHDAPTGGWLGAWSGGDAWEQLAVLPTELRDQLVRRSYDAEAILSTWADRGWLRSDGAHRTRKVTVGTQNPRCVVILRAAKEAVEGHGATAG